MAHRADHSVGWLMYAWVTWVLWAPLILIENVGARGALDRSARLVLARMRPAATMV